MYRQISDFAPDMDNSYSADPVFYCTTDFLDSQFLHGPQGRIFGRYNTNCSEFISQRCAKNWDELCEAISHDRETKYPNTAGPLRTYSKSESCLPYGEQMVRDTAFKKYKTMTMNCNLKCEPFDPTVPNSPMICYETRMSCPPDSTSCLGTAEGGACQSIYSITADQAKVLDQDPVMNRILDKPDIALDLIEQIYTTMKKENTLELIRNTRLGRFYQFLGHQV